MICAERKITCFPRGLLEPVDPDSSAVCPEFFRRDTVSVARDLLGKILARYDGNGWCAGFIVETEAYLGEGDPASHACRKRTPRNETMFGPPGHAYVYFIYGMFYCFNAVAYAPDTQSAGAVLVRALEPASDLQGMMMRRKKDKLEELTSGPGKLCQALGIGKGDNGKFLGRGDLLLLEPNSKDDAKLRVSTRIGITRGIEHPYRFYIDDCAFVSVRGKVS